MSISAEMQFSDAALSWLDMRGHRLTPSLPLRVSVPVSSLASS